MLSGNRQWLYGIDENLFINGTLTVGVSQVTTRSADSVKASMTSADLRLGAMHGITLWETISGYVLARVLSFIHISEPTRTLYIADAGVCVKKKKIQLSKHTYCLVGACGVMILGPACD